MDEPYRFTKVWKAYDAYAQKIGILYPIYDRQLLDDVDVLRGLRQLLIAWRARISDLYAAGWPVIPDVLSMQYLRNCPPSMGSARGNRIFRLCKHGAICPWCRAREISSLFTNIATATLPARGGLREPSFKVIEISSQMLMSSEDAGACLDALLVAWRRQPLNLMKRLDPIGGYYRIDLEPFSVEKKFSAWQFTYHMLLITSPDYVLPAAEINDKRKIRETLVKSKKQLIDPIARTCRYPIGLMYGDPAKTVAALNARTNIKCSAVVGILRGTKGNKGKKKDEQSD